MKNNNLQDILNVLSSKAS